MIPETVIANLFLFYHSHRNHMYKSKYITFLTLLLCSMNLFSVSLYQALYCGIISRKNIYYPSLQFK